ncbi:MAG TPA: class I SAM-dependent methyltransferase [Candidatus Eremiobacteraceae bacterium]|nr:class I SAM-dependent methyltransferase [Candidatus Eremiobacteraceae bacterium]
MQSDFNSLAVDYARFRTSYSDELFDTIVDYARLAPGGRVLDLACGTGLGMLQYAHRGFAVTGVDVAPAMIAQARDLVPAGSPVDFALGRAEALPFPGASFVLVSCAQAFHWFEPHAAFSECARVPRPGGALAIFWKHAARDDTFTLLCEQIIREWMGEEAAIRSRDHAVEHESGWPVFWEYVAPLGSQATGRSLVDGEKRLIEFTLQRTALEFVGYQRSREKIRMVLGDRRDEFFDELTRRLDALGPNDRPVTQRQIQYMFLARKQKDQN